MEIQGSRVMILGGSGLVGMAIAREVLRLRPARLVITALTEAEVVEGVDALRPLAGDAELSAEWGNLFTPAALRSADRTAVLDDGDARGAMLDALFGPLGPEAVERDTLGEMVLRHRPDIVGGALRRRRNELEYPERPGDDATHDEAAEAVDNAQAIITASQGLLDQLGLF